MLPWRGGTRLEDCSGEDPPGTELGCVMAQGGHQVWKKRPRGQAAGTAGLSLSRGRPGETSSLSLHADLGGVLVSDPRLYGIWQGLVGARWCGLHRAGAGGHRGRHQAADVTGRSPSAVHETLPKLTGARASTTQLVQPIRPPEPPEMAMQPLVKV